VTDEVFERNNRAEAYRSNSYLREALAISFGAAMLLWVVLMNGQPFFFPDTNNYVREPDAAVVAIFGSRFATQWTDENVRGLRNGSTSSVRSDLEALGQNNEKVNEGGRRHTNSLSEGIILSGRSVYYGVLLYLGELTGGFWLTVILQALIVSYLIFLLSVRYIGSSVSFYLLSIAVVALFTPASFCIGFLMPDIFAGITILATALLIAFWRMMTIAERTIVGIILAYSLTCHSTHLFICVSILLFYALISSLTRFRSAAFSWACCVTLATCALLGFLSELAFNAVVAKVAGFSPIRPPFITARLIELGPGYQYLKDHCVDATLVVCHYLDKLPLLNSDGFIWSKDPGSSVFGTAPSDIKRALSNEQFSFFGHVLSSDPVGVVIAAFHGGLRQLESFGISEFNYCSNCDVSFVENLPANYRTRFGETLAARNVWPIAAFELIHRGTILVSFVVISLLTLITTRWPRLLSKCVRPSPALNWSIAAVGVGILSNTFVCGLFSGTHDRYEARVIWLVPLLAAVLLGLALHSPIRRPRSRCAATQSFGSLDG
jgi:hypothetical protein